MPLNNPSSTWADYAAACEGDEPAPGVVRAMELHYSHHRVHICSNRPSSAMDQTCRWLKKHDIPYDEMVLAPPELPELGTEEEALLWLARRKIFYCKSLRLREIEPVLFYEDQAGIAQMIYEQAGVPCVIVNPAYKNDNRKNAG